MGKSFADISCADTLLEDLGPWRALLQASFLSRVEQLENNEYFSELRENLITEVPAHDYMRLRDTVELTKSRELVRECHKRVRRCDGLWPGCGHQILCVCRRLPFMQQPELSA